MTLGHLQCWNNAKHAGRTLEILVVTVITIIIIIISGKKLKANQL